MNKIEILDELVNKANDIEDIREKELVLSIFKNSNWYNEINVDMFYSLLSTLNYSNDEIKNIYALLTN